MPDVQPSTRKGKKSTPLTCARFLAQDQADDDQDLLA